MLDRQANSAQETLTLDSDLQQVERLRQFIDAFSDRTALPEQTRDQLTLALEELVVNSIKHGRCNPRAGAIRIEFQRRGDRLDILFSDTGIPFNPLTRAAPNLGEEIGRRPIGGLGIHLVRSLIPEIRYERRDGRNHLFLSKPIEPQPEPTEQQGGSADASRNGNCPR